MGWAIGYDHDTKAMSDDGVTDSERTTFYNRVRECLTRHGFAFKQFSVYTNMEPDAITQAFKACQALKQVKWADKYMKRLHLFRIEDSNDLLPLVADRPSAGRD